MTLESIFQIISNLWTVVWTIYLNPPISKKKGCEKNIYIHTLISLNMPCKIYVFTKPRATTFYNNINYVISAIKCYKILNIFWHWLLILWWLIIGHVWLLTYRWHLWHILCVRMCLQKWLQSSKSYNDEVCSKILLELLCSNPRLCTWSNGIIYK